MGDAGLSHHYGGYLSNVAIYFCSRFTGYADVIGAVLREILIAHFIMAASKARLLELCEIILRELIAVSIMAASKASHEGLCAITETSLASLINLFR